MIFKNPFTKKNEKSYWVYSIMKVKFCPKWNKILIPINNCEKFYLACKPCKHHEEIRDKDFLDSSEELEKIEETGSEVVDDINIFATYPHKWSKCGLKGADVLDKAIIVKLKRINGMISGFQRHLAKGWRIWLYGVFLVGWVFSSVPPRKASR